MDSAVGSLSISISFDVAFSMVIMSLLSNKAMRIEVLINASIAGHRLLAFVFVSVSAGHALAVGADSHS